MSLFLFLSAPSHSLCHYSPTCFYPTLCLLALLPFAICPYYRRLLVFSFVFLLAFSIILFLIGILVFLSFSFYFSSPPLSFSCYSCPCCRLCWFIFAYLSSKYSLPTRLSPSFQIGCSFSMPLFLYLPAPPILYAITPLCYLFLLLFVFLLSLLSCNVPC